MKTAMTCDRCGKKMSIHTVSMFNTDEICLDCKDAETKRPDYQQARDAEAAACRRGDYNFKGIGLKPLPGGRA
jgi:hypothetical protein